MPLDPKIEMTQYYTTVIPIHNAALSPAVSFEFSGGLRLSALPGWVAGQQMLDGLSLHDRQAVKEATHALVLAYPADALTDRVTSISGADSRPKDRLDRGALPS